MSSKTSEVNGLSSAVLGPRIAIVGTISANVAFVIELTLVPLLLTAIQAEFGLAISALGWVFNSYGIAVAVGVFFGGWCGDAFNTRRVFGYGVALFTGGALLVAAAESYESLIVGRIIQGFGGGIFSPLVPVLLTRASPNRPGRVLIVWGSIGGYVAALAPLFYSTFLGGYSWTVAFALNALVALLALVLLTVSTVTDHPERQSTGLRKVSTLFQSSNLWLTFLYVFCTYGSITYYLFRMPIWWSSNEVKAASVGLVLSVLWLTFSGLSTLLRNLVDKPHIQKIMLAAPLLIAAGLPVLSYSDNLWVLIMSAIFIGSGLACSNAPSTQLVLRFAPQGMSALSTSLDITFARLGGITTVAILAETQLSNAATAICLMCLIAAFCTVKIGTRAAEAS